MADDPHHTEPTTPEPGSPEPAGPAGSPGPAGDAGPAGNEPDATQRIGPPTPQPPSDATQLHRPVGDETAILPPRSGDTTIIPPVRPGDTAMLPPATDHRDEGARWAARAGVPRADAAEEEWVPAEEPGGAWWLPLVLGIGGLLLLAVVAIGVWLAFRHSGNAPAPSASPTASPSVSPTPSPTPPPSSSPPASPSAAAVTLPNLRGTSVGDAQQVLSGLGLASTVRNQVDDSLPAGSVIGTEPGAGSVVPPGSTVVLVVAVAPATSNVPSPSRSPGPSPSHG